MSGFLLGLALLAGSLMGMAGVSQSASSAAATRARQGIPGAPAFGGSRSRSGINYSGFVAQVGTIVVTTATDGATYSFTLNGIAFAVVAGTSQTTTTVATAIAAAINAEPRVRGQVTATSSTATVTITANRTGTAGAFTLTESDSKITGTESATAAADGTTLGFGLAVIQTAYTAAATGAPLAGTEKLFAIPAAARFTAQVATLTPTFVASNVLRVNAYEIRGGVRQPIGGGTSHTAFFTAVTDLDTTIDGLVAALEAAAPANTVSYVANNATATAFTATAEIPGTEWEFEFVHQSGGASVPTLTVAQTTGPSEATSLHRAWRGISKYALNVEAATLTSTEGSYPAYSPMTATYEGVVWVKSAQSPSSGDTVYVETAAGSTCGRFYTDASSTRIALSTRVARWERDGLVSTDNLAAIRLGA